MYSNIFKYINVLSGSHLRNLKLHRHLRYRTRNAIEKKIKFTCTVKIKTSFKQNIPR